MSFQIGDTVSDILLETQTTGNRVSNADILLAYKRANDYMSANYKMPTTERESDLLVFPGVYEYPAPSDFLGWFEPKRPYGIVSPWWVNTSENELIHTYEGRQTAFKFDHENLYLLINDNNMPQAIDGSGDIVNNASQLIINECDSLTANGTVTISGDGSNLVSNQQIFVSGSGSIQFLITPSSGTTTITITGMSAVDLTNYFNTGFGFLNLECPTTNTAAITQVLLRIGLNASNYYQLSATTRYRGDTILNGWGIIGQNFLNVTTVGSPTLTSSTWCQIVLSNGTTSATSGIYRLDSIFAANPTYYQLPYYSKYNIKAIDGTYKQYPTATDDTVLCPEDTNEAFIYKALEHIALYNLRDAGRATYFEGLFKVHENQLKVKYPTQERRVQHQYYRSPRTF